MLLRCKIKKFSVSFYILYFIDKNWFYLVLFDKKKTADRWCKYKNHETRRGNIVKNIITTHQVQFCNTVVIDPDLSVHNVKKLVRKTTKFINVNWKHAIVFDPHFCLFFMKGPFNICEGLASSKSPLKRFSKHYETIFKKLNREKISVCILS